MFFREIFYSFLQICKLIKNYLKPKQKSHLMTITGQVFAWHKYVKLFFGCQCSGKCQQLMFWFLTLLVTRKTHDNND